jgi:hypothetical protein
MINREIIVEKTFTHFPINDIFKNPLIDGFQKCFTNLYCTHNQCCFFRENIIIVFMSIPSSVLNNRREKGYEGYKNIINITFKRLQKKELKIIDIIEKNYIISEQVKYIAGVETNYIVLSVRLKQNFENTLETNQLLLNKITKTRQEVIDNISSNIPNIYKFII